MQDTLPEQQIYLRDGGILRRLKTGCWWDIGLTDGWLWKGCILILASPFHGQTRLWSGKISQTLPDENHVLGVPMLEDQNNSPDCFKLIIQGSHYPTVPEIKMLPCCAEFYKQILCWDSLTARDDTRRQHTSALTMASSIVLA